MLCAFDLVRAKERSKWLQHCAHDLVEDDLLVLPPTRSNNNSNKPWLTKQQLLRRDARELKLGRRRLQDEVQID
jgi:hypothetical protein